MDYICAAPMQSGPGSPAGPLYLASETLQTIELPFSEFVPHRLEKALDVSRLRRVGLVAIGRAFQADVSLCEISFYR